jgi:hypothetical protein
MSERLLTPKEADDWVRTGHAYTSTACLHGHHDQCRQACKFCQSTCRCSCHLDTPDPAPNSPEDVGYPERPR